MSVTPVTLNPKEAYEELMRFAGRFGEAPLRLAFHAAIPQSFRLDLLHLIKRNFVPEAKNEPTAESDLLLSPLCKDIGRGYFQFDPNVRHLLLDNLAESYASEPTSRIKRVANFLLWYVNHFNRLTSGSNDRLWIEYLETQRWVALAFIDPEGAALQFAECLQQTISETDVVTRLQLGGLAASLSAPLAGYSHILNYASALQSLETDGPDETIQKFGDFLDREITIGHVTLRPASTILRERYTSFLPEDEEEPVKEDSDIAIEIIGKSPAMRDIRDLISKVASTEMTVLIIGEAGTGKELIAQAIYKNSLRRNKPFLKINCGAIPEDLSEPELFGYEKGAFTAALTQHQGRIEEADGGSLFLNEIGGMSLSAQVKLLRVLQEGEFTRVGGKKVLKTDVRIIAASNIDLEKAVAEGAFRKDLFYRLSVFPMKLPPLRERKEDIPLLADHFIGKHNELNKTKIVGFSDDALQILMKYDWNGNVSELESVITQAIALSSTEWILPESLPKYLLPQPMVESAQIKKSFDYDVYISYSHRDNYAVREEDGWVDYFHKALYKYLTGYLGREVRIWRDRSKMSGNYPLPEAINEALTNSLIFIPILSPSFINSQWCPKELEVFANQRKETSIFPVVKSPIDTLPLPIRENFIKYEFFNRDDFGEIRQQLDPSFGGDSESYFFLKVSDLARELAGFILSNDEVPIPSPSFSSPSPPSSSVYGVYLAEPSPDLLEQYNDIKRDLEQRIDLGLLKCKILPQTFYETKPSNAENYRQKVREEIQKCDLVINLIGKETGGYPRGGNKPYLQLQTEIAAERDGEKGFSRLVWIPRNIQSEDEDHQEFIDRIRLTGVSGDGLMQDSFEWFKSRIIEIIEKKPEVKLPPMRDTIWFYVICHKSDLETVRKVEDLLHKNNYAVFSSADYLEDALRGKSDVNIHKSHNEYLTRCDAVLVYWNEAPLPWIRNNVFDLQSSKAIRKGLSFIFQAIVLDGDLNDESKIRFGTPPLPNLLKINYDDLASALANVQK